MAKGPYYGVIVKFTTDEPFEEVLARTKEGYKVAVQKLPGLRGVMYSHIGETQEYCGTYAFATEEDADRALEVFRENSNNDGRKLIKADVATGIQLL